MFSPAAQRSFLAYPYPAYLNRFDIPAAWCVASTGQIRVKTLAKLIGPLDQSTLSKKWLSRHLSWAFDVVNCLTSSRVTDQHQQTSRQSVQDISIWLIMRRSLSRAVRFILFLVSVCRYGGMILDSEVDTDVPDVDVDLNWITLRCCNWHNQARVCDSPSSTFKPFPCQREPWLFWRWWPFPVKQYRTAGSGLNRIRLFWFRSYIVYSIYIVYIFVFVQHYFILDHLSHSFMFYEFSILSIQSIQLRGLTMAGLAEVRQEEVWRWHCAVVAGVFTSRLASSR